ncbi:hypothetical protein [Mesorhizobium silamurunense]|uniref:hypothetical protein n=1 Tax=Mesorhizobium silamurunense TaxID=499528 RepID=UPI00177C09D1|nr:hypothetical protein [Mesorhizobium silamurunense]
MEGVIAPHIGPMPFHLPEITYPLSIDTIGKLLALGHEVTIHCHEYGCGHSGRVNLVQLARKLGMDHPILDNDLKPHFCCSRCREAGRVSMNFGFVHHALTIPFSAWPREREEERQAVIQGRRR